ncbi:hypothetical protein SEA1_gp0101 [Salmonella phage SEA1]|nr:hypothetical protein SEA1_gp0101 [Salmonella phage SEA1]
MAKLIWEGVGYGAKIEEDIPGSNQKWYTELDVISNQSHVSIYDVDNGDEVSLTKSEAEALVKYLNSVIPTMKEHHNEY